MKGLDHYVGQILDDKYRLERLLGSGGMGAVYLATHLGTERYVALKLIAPEFMRNEEFVERFKREARAAGRLRHPNVVDVTDFGFAEASGEPVAYLVMEYLDGCTLGDVLAEEKRLPLEWVVDILEQVCSAVHEAHQQGIVHRDLKPDNIWLEPNRLGGYRIKVLDFGIAKVGETSASQDQIAALSSGDVSSHSAGATVRLGGGITQAQPAESATFAAASSEAATLIPGRITNLPSPVDEPEEPLVDAEQDLDSAGVSTRLFSQPEANAGTPSSVSTILPSDSEASGPVSDLSGEDGDRTLLFDQTPRPLMTRATSRESTSAGSELTRVGAIMGTPAYMSPEQCAAKPSDARSDIYSLGIIAYQMLAGDPPFAGNTGSIIREHIDLSPPPLRDRAKKVPKRVANLIMSTLAKDPASRPQTALAFGNSLGAQAASIGSLYRRAFALYSEHFPKFLKISLIAHLPFIVTTIALIALQLAENAQPAGWGPAKIAIVVVMVCVGLLQVVAQFLAAAAISGMTAVIVTQLQAAPLRPVDVRLAFAFLRKRWKPFLKTAISVTLRILIGFVLLVIPGIIMTVRYALYAPVVLLEGLEKKVARLRARELASRSWRTVIIVSLLQFIIPMAIGALVGQISFGVSVDGKSARQERNEILKQISALVNIFVVPLISIVPALLYLKMRQLGGETLSGLLNQLEEADDRSSRWQQRMRTRVSLHTPRSR